jgi:hypothetical protein
MGDISRTLWFLASSAAVVFMTSRIVHASATVVLQTIETPDVVMAIQYGRSCIQEDGLSSSAYRPTHRPHYDQRLGRKIVQALDATY